MASTEEGHQHLADPEHSRQHDKDINVDNEPSATEVVGRDVLSTSPFKDEKDAHSATHTQEESALSGGAPDSQHPQQQQHGSTKSPSAIEKEHTSPPSAEPGMPDSKATLQQTTTAQSTPAPPYTIYSPSVKLALTAMATFTSIFSPLSSTIYYPALPTLASEFNVSTASINLTVTTFLILQGLAPSIVGTFGDVYGRRPAYIVALTIYVAANIGLAVQNSYGALLGLRALQAAGASGTVALSIASIADFAAPHERGKYMGLAFGGVMLAPAVGPVVGGSLAEGLGWRTIFWFLLIASGLVLVLYVLFVPETARVLVGNGSIEPPRWNRSVLQALRGSRKGDAANEEEKAEVKAVVENPKVKRQMPNPLKVLLVCRDPDMVILLSMSALTLAVFYDVVATLPTFFKDLYGYNDLQIGLCYLPFGVGSAIASFLNGRFLDWNYKRTAIAHGVSTDRRRGEELRYFPIEKARLAAVIPMQLACASVLLCYAWAINQRSMVAGPLVLHFILGLVLMCTTNSIQTLTVDLYPMAPGMVTASNNLFRCLLGAAATACIDPMVRGVGAGWAFTILALIVAATTPLYWLELKQGPRWREARWVRETKKKGGLEAKTSEKK